MLRMTMAQSPLEQDSNANQSNWPACFAMLIAWIAHLFEQIAKLKKVRQHTRFKPGWQSHWPDLRQSEWHRDQLLAAGAAQILAGKDIDTG